jgi:hypothetical protein
MAVKKHWPDMPRLIYATSGGGYLILRIWGFCKRGDLTESWRSFCGPNVEIGFDDKIYYELVLVYDH